MKFTKEIYNTCLQYKLQLLKFILIMSEQSGRKVNQIISAAWTYLSYTCSHSESSANTLHTD